MSLQEYRPGKWRVVIYAGRKPDGSPIQRTRSVGTGISKQEARRRAPAIEAALRAEAETEQRKAGTVAELADEWIEFKIAQGRSPITIEGYRHNVKQITQQFGTQQVDAITGRDIDRWLTALLSDGVGRSTVDHYYAVLSAMFNQAVKWDMIDYSPITKATRPKRPKAKIAPPTVPAFVAAMKQLPESDFRRIIELTALTGLRRGELCGLLWSDVDESGTLTVQRAVKEVKGRGAVYGPTKTGEERTIRLSTTARAILVEQHAWLAETVPGGAVAPGTPIFPHLTRDIAGTRPYAPSHLNYLWRKWRDKIGLPGCRIHDLRHLNITTMLNAGAKPRAAADLAGHSRVSITTDVYGHGTDEATDEAVEIIDTHLGAQLRPKELTP